MDVKEEKKSIHVSGFCLCVIKALDTLPPTDPYLMEEWQIFLKSAVIRDPNFKVRFSKWGRTLQRGADSLGGALAHAAPTNMAELCQPVL
jgi:hypothetical protein